MDGRAKDIIETLGLRPLPLEGGYYAETYRSTDRLRLTTKEADARALSTAIYLLVTGDRPTALHRLPSDEIYHFYCGDPVELLTLYKDGTASLRLLGTDLSGGQRPQAVVPAEAWQGVRLCGGGRFALLGTTMAPGFDFADYEPGDPEVLAAAFPAFSRPITLWKDPPKG